MRGPLGIPDCPAQQELFKKRFPHRFLPSGGALHLVHAICQSLAGLARILDTIQPILGKALNDLTGVSPVSAVRKWRRGWDTLGLKKQ
jgi:hypothetical protein